MGVRMHFRLKWIALFASICLVSGAAFFYMLRRILSVDLGSQYAQAYYRLKSTESLLFSVVGLSTLTYFLLAGVLATLATMYITNRVAWPLLHLETFAECLRRGELRFPPRLRHRDQLRKLADAINELKAHLIAPLEPIGRSIERIEELWYQLDIANPAEHDRVAMEVLAKLQAELTVIRENLARLTPHGSSGA